MEFKKHRGKVPFIQVSWHHKLPVTAQRKQAEKSSAVYNRKYFDLLTAVSNPSRSEFHVTLLLKLYDSRQ
jgi:hypothetical protein